MCLFNLPGAQKKLDWISKTYALILKKSCCRGGRSDRIIADDAAVTVMLSEMEPVRLGHLQTEYITFEDLTVH